LYYHELKELEKEIENYFYLPTFSREPEDIPVRKGYVHSVYEEIILTEKRPAYFYLCGWKNMIDEAKQRILALGYDKKDIHLELYG
jgi:ferredoxin-NADP reductase